MKTCSICHKPVVEKSGQSAYAEAGEWLAAEVWQDAGQLCSACLESRATLAMMYLHEHNT
jgi:hypothetical protein